MRIAYCKKNLYVLNFTGTNACYLEEINDIHTIDQKEFANQRYMIINTEWGGMYTTCDI